MSNDKLSPIEAIKVKSDGLRGTLKESLTDNHTGNVRPDDEALVKFHGMYVQDDRDRRAERAAKKLDKLYSFMIRLRIPGGVITADQWLATHEISEEYGTGTLKITTRQTIQLHGLLKHQLQPTIQGFLLAKLDSIAACGDVNRNVTCSSHPQVSPLFQQIYDYADKISTLLLPKTQSYYEVWIDGEKIYERSSEADPLYQDRYLPRKFKIAIAIPPSNDVDVFSNDIGLIAIIKDGQLKGFNIAIGGGLATTHGNPNTYSRLATIIGFTDTEAKTLKAVYEVLTIQRDYGNRSDRKLSRLKYTVDKLGVDNFKKELEKRIGFALLPEESYAFTERNDRYGWQENYENKWFYTLFVEHGVIKSYQKQFLYELAQLQISDFRFTCNQNLILGEISAANKEKVTALIAKYKIEEQDSAMRKSSMACVAMPTCPLALAEAQRYLPELVTKIEPFLKKYDLEQDEISIRMTGCPNGCGRPYLAEIGFVGTGPGQYNLMLGGDRLGNRLNQVYKKQLTETEILTELDGLFDQYTKERIQHETFGDFTHRKFFAVH
ncbi:MULTISPECIES: NADPH-dependent assimilatory sulfite reductase hemoprotein subunit [unclassified Flavobacterium]|uniref:NADPH-dependent assimilatory sulfite reductase hemoprotein subunit n=1 Tax=unclassified Flavobacterium TaxID=196869 RepID=UPI000967D15C|nr:MULTISPECIES: NADPH-dependent assimilatory sulfite reductase hemoprotein subunit [unclassified Flavobacterium]MBN9283823.1 NADPH-dependent assimilatory sulfite reductase hemoprotein subunit [Flavobacterium sp.]OJV68673.1 MAG: sulfite reductase subunit beta [Flavobacterium sp. 40-81]